MKNILKIIVGFISLHFNLNVHAQEIWGLNDSIYTLEQIDFLHTKKQIYKVKDKCLLTGWLKVETKSFVRFTHYSNGLLDGFEIEYDRKNLNRASYVSYYLKGTINYKINFDKELEIKSYSIYKPDLSDPTLSKTTYNFKKVSEKLFFYDPIGHFKYSVKTKLNWNELGKYYADAINLLRKNIFSLNLIDFNNPFYSIRTDGFYCQYIKDDLDSQLYYSIRFIDKSEVLVIKSLTTPDTLNVNWNDENVIRCRIEMVNRTHFQLKKEDEILLNLQIIRSELYIIDKKEEFKVLIFYPFN